MAWVERDGVRLYVERAGSGPPLLCISGTGGDLRVKPTVFDFPFASSFDMLAYDQRGLGQSDQPPGPYSMADYADDAAGVIEWAGWEQVGVLGISFGGMVAQELVLRPPALVARLVLACTSSGGAGGSSYPLHELAGLDRAESAERELALVDTRWADPGFEDPLRALFAQRVASAPPPSAGDLLQLEARSHHDTWERLPQVRCPVLVCGGRFDALAPPENVRALAARIPGARLAEFDGGHAFIVQDPCAIGAIGEFLLARD